MSWKEQNENFEEETGSEVDGCRYAVAGLMSLEWGIEVNV